MNRLIISVSVATIAAVALAQPSAHAAPGAVMSPVALQTPIEPVTDPVPQDGVALAIDNYLTDLTADPAGTSRSLVKAVTEFYAARANAPVWTDQGRITDRGRSVIATIRDASEDGIDPRHFDLPTIPEDAAMPTSNWATAEIDVKLTVAVLDYAKRAMSGSVAPSQISDMITRRPPQVDPQEALTRLADATDPGAVLEAFNPPQDGFRRLRAKLAEVRQQDREATPVTVIPVGRSLHPGMRDARVALLRTRLGVPETQVDSDIYDSELEAAVRAFQQSKGLTADAVVGPNTLAVLNGEARDKESEIIANMEMWRWMPRDLGNDYIFVNVPNYEVSIRRNGKIVHEARVVVGTVKNQTPIFSDEMEYLVVNPYWNVPVSIATKEMLHQIQKNPAAYFARHGYEALYNGHVVDPSMIWWDQSTLSKVRIRQPPGEANALGHIKFMFPNAHAVYLHDTPSRSLFQKDFRAYSHGCVRVQDPFAFAQAILEDEPNVTLAQVKGLIGKGERRVDLDHHIPVHIAYFTAWVDDDGALQMRNDIYGHTARMKAALGL
ncbi:murein L,D-transpeptidase [Hartmannibacter diazotrophicus]|uniref:Murein L,D-transpeptidase n=1 Tax=Hartmannibacter diazotrophicus TaxID=1482074 RepID=A0A2C9DA74_9HYPH|nr:L,D-transpeptidase family protein [Hartmannibacter diazotrophicus]SON57222.1 murein L,D-transpeptidase [Hartmannibacter diazotrophicus]